MSVPLRIRGSGSRRTAAKYIKLTFAAVVVALVLIGQGIVLVRTIAAGGGNAAIANVPVPRTGPLSHRLEVAAENALGPSDRNVRRFSISSISIDKSRPRLRDVTLRWSINNDIGAEGIGNGAQLDAYALFRSIYESGLPVALVRLWGTYPTRGDGRENVVMRLALPLSMAVVIGRNGWSNLDAEGLWALVIRSYIAPDFQPISSE